MAKRYLTLAPQPKASKRGRAAGASSHKSNKQQKEYEDAEKLRTWNELGEGGKRVLEAPRGSGGAIQP